MDACNKGKINLPGDDNPLISVLNCGASDPIYTAWAKLGLTNALQTELREDIFPIIAPETNLTREELRKSLERLVDKINEIDLRPQWQVKEFEEDDPRPITGGVVEIQDYSWAIIRHTQIPSGPKEQFLRKILYTFIAFVLETGKLTELRKCGACSRIFVIYDVRRRFCSDGCRISFNNIRRLKEGYFSKLRKRKRQRASKRCAVT